MEYIDICLIKPHLLGSWKIQVNQSLRQEIIIMNQNSSESEMLSKCRK